VTLNDDRSVNSAGLLVAIPGSSQTTSSHSLNLHSSRCLPLKLLLSQKSTLPLSLLQLQLGDVLLSLSEAHQSLHCGDCSRHALIMHSFGGQHLV